MSLLAPETIDLQALPSLPLAQRLSLPNIPAIYFVINTAQEVLYIGAAQSLCLRWYHHNYHQQFAEHGNVYIAWMQMHSHDVMYEAERELICYFRPQYNKAHKAPLPGEELQSSAMTLGQRVEKLRKERKMNQDELADRADISQGLLSRIERGRTPDPGASVLKGLARALGCSIDYLVDLYGDDHAPSSSSMVVSA